MIEKLKSFIEESNKEIREKLVTEINVEFPENKILVDSLLTKDFKDKIKEQLEGTYKYIERCGYKDVEELKSKLNECFYKNNSNIDDFLKENEKAIDFLRNNKLEENDNENNNRLYELLRVNNNLYKIEEYIKSQVIVVNGDGGTGKTHLLTKIVNDLINNDVPSIIFYGQTIYKFEEYIKYIEQKMKIGDLFEEINKAAELNNETGIIIFDAINEARQNQKDIIEYLINNIKEKNIKLIISYGNGDVEQQTLDILSSYPNISLYGFSDAVEAAVKFSEHYNIEIGEILESNYANNPLILKIFCEEYGEKGKTKGQRGYNTATFIFERYFTRISQNIINELGVVCNDGNVITGKIFWNKIAKEIAKLMVKQCRTYLFEKELVSIVDNLNLNISSAKIIEKLVVHKLIEVNNMYIGNNQRSITYKFSFQRQSDYLIARYLLNTKDENESWNDFLNKNTTIKMLENNMSLIETLVEHIPIRTGKELFEFYDDTMLYSFNYSYLLGLRYRSKESFGKNIQASQKQILDYIKSSNLDEEDFFDWMITISSSMLVTYHPLNVVYYFSKLMKKLKNNIRDMYLRDFLNIDIIRTRIISISKIPYYADLSKFNYNLKQNFVQLFLWMLSVPDREIRDKSSKALTAFLASDLTLIDELIDIISNVDDQYIIERFLCCIHSAHILNNDNDLLKIHYNKIRQMFCSKSISNVRIRHYLMSLNHLCYDRKIINTEKNFNNICKKPTLIIEYISKKDFYKLLSKTGRYNNVMFSMSHMGDFARYIVEPRMRAFIYYDKKVYDILKKEKLKLISSLTTRQKYLYEKMIITSKQMEINEMNMYEELNYDINKILEMTINNTNKYEDLFNNSLGKRKKEKLNNLNTNIEKCKNKEIPEELYMAIILKKMLDLGYNKKIENYDKNRYSYDRHEHRIERIGKKYQWIAFFELLGECMTNLQVKKDAWQDYYDFVDIDIDTLQYKNQPQVVYDFYDLYIKRIKEAKINWEQEKFNQTYDNINVLDCLKKIEFDGKTFIPIHISEMIKNKLNEKKCFYRLNTLKNSNITNYGKSELNNVSMSSGTTYYRYNLYEINTGGDELMLPDEERNVEEIWKECYIESEYDCSNIEITNEDKNRTYMLLKYDIIKLLNLRYDYSGIYYDDTGIATIQSPFDSDSTYFYIREDLYKKILKQFNIIIGVYSEKEFETNNPKSISKYEICCAIDAAYEYKDDNFRKIAIYKRDEDIII